MRMMRKQRRHDLADDQFVAETIHSLKDGGNTAMPRRSGRARPPLDPLLDKLTARDFVASRQGTGPFFALCVERLTADPFWLPSESQAELLNRMVAR